MKTLIVIRPDAVRRGLVGEILTRFERHGIRIVGLRVMQLTKEKTAQLYKQHENKPYYQNLVDQMTAGPMVACVLDTDVLDTDSAVALVRRIIGNTDPAKAEMGTIRGDFGLRIEQNIIHASDSRESANQEIPLFFDKTEIVKFNETEQH
ncbi:Nucleoside diphosphate kinase [uncultured archaeon]|nr:Nucleoside diphosphate kinase [uncultured archaeon]